MKKVIGLFCDYTRAPENVYQLWKMILNIMLIKGQQRKGNQERRRHTEINQGRKKNNIE
jgi:hypothetical protein